MAKSRNLKSAVLFGISVSVIGAVLLGLNTDTAKAAAIRIMPLGDSITSGYTKRTDNWAGVSKFTFGYRGPLYTQLTNAGYNFKFVGGSTEPWTQGHVGSSYSQVGPTNPSTQMSGIDLRTVDQDYHRGYWGQTTDFINANIVNWLNADNPDVVLLMIGTNNADLDDGNETANPTYSKNQLHSLVQAIVNTKPAAKIIVAEISPRNSNSSTGVANDPSAAVLAYNSYIRTLPQEFANVTTVDQFANFCTGGVIDAALMPDNVHPSVTGYQRIATTWFNGIQAAAPTPEPGTFCLFGAFALVVAARGCWHSRRRS